LTDKAPCYEIGCQTNIEMERQKALYLMPFKRGVDKKTLVEDNELFSFEEEVEPILSVLCGKTLESARMEVLEEEELREMREQQEHYNRMLQAENTDIQRMEQTEAKKLQDFERLKATMREKKKNK
jgi:predicted RNase H-like nuclease (RuvC/YqgF family)